MAKLNTSAIDDILNKFLEPFEATAFAGYDFAYFYKKSEIMYSFVTDARMDKLFMLNAKNLGLKCKIDTFLLAFLHELGHHETLDQIEDQEADYSRDVKKTLTSTDEDCIIYFNLPDERAATEWAINYIHNHAEELARLWQDLQPAILNFYQINNIH